MSRYPTATIKGVESGASFYTNMKIYLSDPITGQDDPHGVFKRYKERLQKEFPDAVIINPLDNGVPFESPWEDHLKADIRNLVGCDAIWFIPGWIGSKGCMLEYTVATECGLKLETFR